MVAKRYGRFLPQDKAAIAAKILNQVWQAAWEHCDRGSVVTMDAESAGAIEHWLGEWRSAKRSAK